MVSRARKYNIVFLIIMFFIFNIITPSIYTSSTIYNQDGVSFSGNITVKEVIDHEMIGYNNWPEGFTKGGNAFRGGVYDGTNIWMIPYVADRLIKLNLSTGEMAGYDNWPEGFTKVNAAFWGGVYDGNNIWMIPHNADRVVKVNALTGEMTGYNNWPSGFIKGNSAFVGAVYDGTNIWMIPGSANMLIKMNTLTGEMTGYNNWPMGFSKNQSSFGGGVYDGTNIWIIPHNADRIIRVNASTGQMVGYNNWPTGFTKENLAFYGGVYDGTNVWMIPYNADRVIKINVSTGQMTGYNNWPSGYTRGFNAFKGGVYDGTNIWMIPYSTARVVKLNALTGEMTSYNNWPSGFSKASFAFVGGVHNGRNIWMIPNSADRIIKLKSRLNNDAGLTSVVGQNDSSPAGGNGQSEIERLIWNVNVGYEIERVGISDIVVADDATMNLYKNSNFTDGEIIGEESVELIAAGETTVYVKVTAEDSTTIRYYEVRINREGSSDAGLTSIVGQSDSNPSGGTGETELEVITWNVDVPYEKEKVGLSDIVVADNATMNLYTNSNFTDGETTGEDTVELIAAGETTVYVKVTAEDSTTIRYYEVRINREGSSNSNLATLLTSIGTLSPEFDTETKDYRVNVANSVSRIALTPIAEDENAIITVNGEVVLSGESSEPINLHVGTNTINIEVISEDNTNTKTYIVAVRRQASIDVSETLIPEENTTEKEEVAKEENEYTDSEDEREKEDTEFVDDRVITTTEVKEDLIEEQLNQNIRSITIPASENAQNVVARLNVETVKRIKEKEAEIEVKNDIASYRIPASEIMNDEITKQFGENAEGNNIVVDISVKRADSQKTEKLQNVSRANGFEVVANPVEFKVSVSQGEKRVEINRFNRYIERRIAIPENVDITRNITGVVLEEDGTVRQVPTRIVEVDGKYYAQIRSITNSVYSIISNPIEFKDAENHWARENLNDMGSRMIISGNEELIEPEREVTRGEFVGIVLRALGIRGERGIANFQDILEIADSDLGYIETVYEKGLVSGYEDGNFRGNEIITRQEAMVIISRAMKITGLDIEVSDDDLKDFITEYKDFATISEWAKSSVLQSIRAGIVVGRGNESLEVNKNLNISEAATMVRRLLQKSDLL